jgi:hypothetical protein
MDEHTRKTRLVRPSGPGPLRPEDHRPTFGRPADPDAVTVFDSENTARGLNHPPQPPPLDSATQLVGRPNRPKPTQEPTAPDPGEFYPTVGCLLVIGGPGKGQLLAIRDGHNSVGRGPDQAVRLDFGDPHVSASGSFFITYDNQSRTYYISKGMGQNIVRLGTDPVIDARLLVGGEIIRIGDTALKFFGFCTPEWDWDDEL